MRFVGLQSSYASSMLGFFFVLSPDAVRRMRGDMQKPQDLITRHYVTKLAVNLPAASQRLFYFFLAR